MLDMVSGSGTRVLEIPEGVPLRRVSALEF